HVAGSSQEPRSRRMAERPRDEVVVRVAADQLLSWRPLPRLEVVHGLGGPLRELAVDRSRAPASEKERPPPDAVGKPRERLIVGQPREAPHLGAWQAVLADCT